MANENQYLPFSQRTGLEPIPPQLKLREVSDELRRLLDYCIDLEISRVSKRGVSSLYLDGEWKRVAQDLHVVFFGRKAAKFNNEPHAIRAELGRFVETADIGRLFDLVEFLFRHEGCTNALRQDFENTLVQARSAYRFVDAEIIAIGTDQQGEAVEAAIHAAEIAGAVAARSHLIQAGKQLRDGNWPDSVRESIHAVESVALRLTSKATKLSPALAELESKGYLHGGLKTAFSSLYGYSSDEEGVRHAKVFGEETRVDETDALFMLGACASFVSYVIARSR